MSMSTLTLDSWSKYVVPTAKTLDERINVFIKELFDFNFPWYLDNYSGLADWERMFVVKYWEREIGFDTTDLFKLKLWELLTRKMPYYRMLAEQQGLIGNIFINVDETSINESDFLSNIDSKSGKSVDEVVQESTHQTTDSTGTTNDKKTSDTHTIISDNNIQLESGTETSENSLIENGQKDTKTNSDTTSEGGKILNKETEEKTKDNETVSGTVSTSKNETTNVSDNLISNMQGLTSQNPQITIATKDYANQLERNETINNGNKDTVISGTNNESTNDTRDKISSKTGSSSDNETEHRQDIIDSTVTEKDTKNNQNDSKTTLSKDITATHTNDTSVNATDNTTGKTTDNTISSSGKDNTRTLSDDTKTNETRADNRHDKNNIKGWRGSRADEYKKFSEAIQNINELLLNDCNILFLGILPNPFVNNFPMKVW